MQTRARTTLLARPAPHDRRRRVHRRDGRAEEHGQQREHLQRHDLLPGASREALRRTPGQRHRRSGRATATSRESTKDSRSTSACSGRCRSCRRTRPSSPGTTPACRSSTRSSGARRTSSSCSMYYRIFFQVRSPTSSCGRRRPTKLRPRGVSTALAGHDQDVSRRSTLPPRAELLARDRPLRRRAARDRRLSRSARRRRSRRRARRSSTTSSRELKAIRADLPAPKQGEYGRADQGAAAMLLAKLLHERAGLYAARRRYADARSPRYSA